MRITVLNTSYYGNMGYTPFCYTTVRGLHPDEFQQRADFCEWLLQQHEADNAFIVYILWTDKACFTLDGVFNSHKSHMLGESNTNPIHQHKHQVSWSINMCVDILGSRLIGPHLLPEWLMGQVWILGISQWRITPFPRSYTLETVHDLWVWNTALVHCLLINT